MALPRANRLSLRLDRDRLTKTGKTSHGKFFTLVAAPPAPRSPRPTGRDEVGPPKFAILLSKKTASLAVDRNKIKRITSAIIGTLLSSLPTKDYMVIPKRQVLTENYKILEEDLKSLFSK